MNECVRLALLKTALVLVCLGVIRGSKPAHCRILRVAHASKGVVKVP